MIGALASFNKTSQNNYLKIKTMGMPIKCKTLIVNTKWNIKQKYSSDDTLLRLIIIIIL